MARESGLNVETNPPSMIAEDFSRYLKLAPGALFRIGTGGGFDNHHPSFTADPSALLPAAQFFATLAERNWNNYSNTSRPIFFISLTSSSLSIAPSANACCNPGPNEIAVGPFPLYIAASSFGFQPERHHSRLLL